MKNVILFALVIVSLIGFVAWMITFMAKEPGVYEKYNDFGGGVHSVRQRDLEEGKRVFLGQCSPCHERNGAAKIPGAANLNIWGSEKAIEDVILKGSQGMNYGAVAMPAGLVGAHTAKAIAAYVAKEISAIKSTRNEALVEIGRREWAACVACHGEDGRGLDGLAPDLTKYGSESFVIEAMKRGKNDMPSFEGALKKSEENALAKYIISLSKSDGEDKNGGQSK